MEKLRVGVIMGGKSIEHEVSFNSGRTVCDHLDTDRYDIIPLFQTKKGTLYKLPLRFLHRGKTADFIHRLESEAHKLMWDDLKDVIDFMFIALHGQYAEDGTLQGFLDILGIPYLGAKVLASALCMDKIMQKKILRHNNIDVARDITLSVHMITQMELPDKASSCVDRLGAAGITFPVVVKPSSEGSSLGVTIAHNEAELPQAIHTAAYISEKAQPVLIEEKIAGMEFSCITLTDATYQTMHALQPTEIVLEAHSALFCYTQKYMPGRASKFTPARCSPEQIRLIQDTCIATTKALGITNMSRIDGFLTPDNKVIIIDPNSLSGMGPASFLFREAAQEDMNHTQVINHLIETELHAYGMLEPLIAKENNHMNIGSDTLRIAVLMGGQSHEKEISLESGRNVTYKLNSRYTVIPIFVSDDLHLYPMDAKILIGNSTKEIKQMLSTKEPIAWDKLSQHADFVFNALHGGHGEDGSVQGTLEMLELPYNGSGVLTSALCIDKYKTNQFLKHEGFDVPQALLLSNDEIKHDMHGCVKKIVDQIGLPAIIKPHNDGCSTQVQKVKTPEGINQELETCLTADLQSILVEECITGMELTVGCLGNDTIDILPPSQVISTQDVLTLEEKFLPGAGTNITPAPLDKKTVHFVQKTIKEIYRSLGCKGYARIDCFFQDQNTSPNKKPRLICLEVNTLPGLTPATVLFHQAAELNITPQAFIDKIIQLGMQEHVAHQQAPLQTVQY